MNFQHKVFHKNRLFIDLEFTPIKNTQIQVDYLKHHIRNNNLNRFMVGLSFQTNSRQPRTTLRQ